VQREEHQDKRGRLYILLGMCPGVGKTYAMLLLARQRQLDGLTVLAGIVETHGREDTAALLADLAVLPRKRIEHGGHTLEEFDLDGAIQRRPDLLLVDELAHTNAPGSRHLKRYQDVLELLDSGIDVCTTLNVQHIESQVDIVRQVTGVTVRETVPDSILDRAHEIQLVDLSVEKLLLRLAEGKVYLGERAEAAATGFFREGNLTALRELALRFTAERVDRDLEDIRKARRVGSPWKTNARLLVAVGPTPYSESLIRWTRRASGRHGCPWLAVWVERSQPLTTAQQELLGRALGLARKLGGEVVHATGDEVAASLLEVARERNVSQIIVGKSDRRWFWRPSLADRIIAGSGDIDVSVVRPVSGRAAVPRENRRQGRDAPVPFQEYGVVLGTVGVLTAVCWHFEWVAGYTLPAMVYLFAILLAAFRLSRGPMVCMAALSALAWNFFFIPPRFTFQIGAPEDIVLLVMFFAVALSMGHLTTRLRTREIAEHRRQTQTAALLRVTQSAALVPEIERGLAEALATINSVIGADTALVVRDLDHSLPANAHPASTWQPSDLEFGVANWAYANKQAAGRFTDTLPLAAATWFPLQTATSVMGVLGLRLARENEALDFTRRQSVEAFALQLALVLEKEHFIHAVGQAELMEKSERLRGNLLDNVSHELKTPLAIIRASLEGMGPAAAAANPYLREIDTATKRLQRLVDGLLQMTRLESQVVEPNLEWCDLTDVVDGALQAAGDAVKDHPVTVNMAPDMPLVRTDQALLGQSLTNILHNAAVYSPPQRPIELSVSHAARELRLSIRDHGPGLPPGEESSVFAKFYRAAGAPAGGTGLGLSIARGFVLALGGDISASNHPQGGAVMEIRLPVEFMTHPDDGACIPAQIAENSTSAALP